MVDDKGSHFQATFPDVFADYQNPPLTGNVGWRIKAWHNWKSTPFDWWQCQLNFAIWYATAGCGVSYEDHLQAKNPFLASLYRFHVYYTTGIFSCICASPSPEILRTPGTKMITIIGPSNAFAMSTVFRRIRTGDRSSTMGVRALAVIFSIWSPQEPIATRTKPRDRSFTRSMPFAITGTSHEPGRPSSSTRASLV